jgi:ADP-ribose pyrophosphatase YjhB (NUDIX family)
LQQTFQVVTSLVPIRRIAAYGLCTDRDGRFLLVRASPRSGTPGVWSLPGGAVDHGEHPFDTVVRETAAETGLSVAIARLVDVLADLRAVPDRGVTIHTDRLIYAVTLRGGSLRDRIDQPTDLARFVAADELAAPGVASVHRDRARVPVEFGDERPEDPALSSMVRLRKRRRHCRRSTRYRDRTGCPGRNGFAAYAVATDPRGRVLLTRIADGYPGGGQWHLPGGGTDYGEQPGAALIREITEETGQHGRPAGPAGGGQSPRRRLAGARGLPDRLARGARVLPGHGGPADPTAGAGPRRVDLGGAVVPDRTTRRPAGDRGSPGRRSNCPDDEDMKYQRVIEAYGLGQDADGRLLGFETADGQWAVPGDPVRHGEHPEDAVARAAATQLGGAVEVVGARAVVTDIDKTARLTTHYDRIVFDVRPVSVPAAVWLSADELAGGRWRPPRRASWGVAGPKIITCSGWSGRPFRASPGRVGSASPRTGWSPIRPATCC